jgi:hypothetical protein
MGTEHGDGSCPAGEELESLEKEEIIPLIENESIPIALDKPVQLFETVSITVENKSPILLNIFALPQLS